MQCAVWDYDILPLYLLIWILVTGEQFCRINCGNIQITAGTLNAQEEYAMFIGNFIGMKAAMYGQVRPEEMLNAGRAVSDHSHSPVQSFLEVLNDTQAFFSQYMYPVFTFEPLPSLQLCILKLLRTLLSPDTYVLKGEGVLLLAVIS